MRNKSALSFFCHIKVNGTQKSLSQQCIKRWFPNSSLSPHLVWEEHGPETAAWHLSCVLCMWFSQLLFAFFNPTIKTETNSFKFFFSCMHRTCSYSPKFPIAIPILLLCSERALAAKVLPRERASSPSASLRTTIALHLEMNCIPLCSRYR